jgi:DNA-binding CsgD family transcriptional regulator
MIERYEVAGASWFRMLETVREFAHEHLAASDEFESVAARHAAWCVRFVEATRRSGALSQQHGLDRLKAEQPNLRAALSWLLDQGEVTMALRLAGAAAEFWLRHGHLREGIQWLERALAADSGPATAARANALVGLNMLLWSAAAQDARSTAVRGDAEPGPYARCVELLAEAEAVARAAGDPGPLAYARLHQGYVGLFRGELDLARERGEEALTAAAAIPQAFSVHGAFWLLAEVATAHGDDAEAATRLAHLLELGRAHGDLISVTNALYGLAALAERRGEPRQALLYLAESATTCRGYGDHLNAALCFAHAAGIAFTAGHREAAARLFAAADAEHFAVTGTRAEGHYVRHREAYIAAARATAGAAAHDALPLPDGLTPEAAIAEMRALAEGLGANTAPAEAPALTSREQEVVRLLVQGYADKEIGAALGITRRTVVWHMSAIRRKLQASSRTSIVAIAVRDHLI